MPIVRSLRGLGPDACRAGFGGQLWGQSRMRAIHRAGREADFPIRVPTGYRIGGVDRIGCRGEKAVEERRIGVAPKACGSKDAVSKKASTNAEHPWARPAAENEECTRIPFSPRCGRYPSG